MTLLGSVCLFACLKSTLAAGTSRCVALYELLEPCKKGRPRGLHLTQRGDEYIWYFLSQHIWSGFTWDNFLFLFNLTWNVFLHMLICANQWALKLSTEGCMFFLCLCGFSPGPVASSKVQRQHLCLRGNAVMSEWLWTEALPKFEPITAKTDFLLISVKSWCPYPFRSCSKILLSVNLTEIWKKTQRFFYMLFCGNFKILHHLI